MILELSKLAVPEVLWNTWTQVSASQVKAYNMCPRFWGHQSAMRLREPQTEAQARGSSIHKHNEHYLKTGKLLGLGYDDYTEAAKAYLPEFGSEHVMVEHEFTMQTFVGGPRWKGYIDLVLPERKIPLIMDHKSTSGFRYALTPLELSEDTQMNSYARWLFEYSDQTDTPIEQIELVHLSLLTSNKKKRTTLYRSTVVTRASVTAVWERDMATVAKMLADRSKVRANPKKLSVQDLTPHTQHCARMYGKPCPHYGRCKPPPPRDLDTLICSEEGENEVNLMEKIQADKAAKAASNGVNGTVPPAAPPATTEAAAPPPAAAPPASPPAASTPPSASAGPAVLPPDGASRTTPVETSAAEPEKKKSKGRPKLTSAQKAANRAAKTLKIAEEATKLAAEEAAKEAAAAPEASAPPDTGRTSCRGPNLSMPPRPDAPETAPETSSAVVAEEEATGAPPASVIAEEAAKLAASKPPSTPHLYVKVVASAPPASTPQKVQDSGLNDRFDLEAPAVIAEKEATSSQAQPAVRSYLRAKDTPVTLPLSGAVLEPTEVVTEESRAIIPPAVTVEQMDLTLYIDSRLIKPRDESVMQFEDFIRPMLDAVEEAHGVVDIRLISFGKGKGYLTDEIRRRIDTWPTRLHINSESFGAREAIDVMMRYASRVIA